MNNRHKHLDALIAKVKAAETTHDLPWHRGVHRPTNMSTGRAYRGVNTLNLLLAGFVREYETPYWMTFNQARKMDGMVRKGEKGTGIVFFKPIIDPETGESRPVIRFSTVFNIEQIAGIEAPAMPERPSTHMALDTARAFAANIPVPVEHTGDMACYIPSKDKILMPPETSFFDTETACASQHYLSVLLHEQVHSTGHKSRLDRLASIGAKKDYAFEELIAEIGAALLGIDLGVAMTVRDDHASYLKSWQSAIGDDPAILMKAAAAAEKAIDLLTSYQSAEEIAA